MAASLKGAARLAALLLVVGVVLTGCGSSKSSSGGTTTGTTTAANGTTVNGVPVKRDSVAAAQLPTQYRSGLQLVTSAPYAPFEVFDANHQLAGLDIDMGNAIAAALGVKAHWSSIPLEGVIPGLQAHKYDLGLADFGATATRLQALDFITYFDQGDVLAVAKGNPKGIKGLQSMCGKALLAESGISLDNFIPPTQALCKKYGKPAVDVKQLPDQSSVLLGIRSGKGDAGVLSLPAAKALEASSAGAPYDIVVPAGMSSGFVPRYVGVGLAKDVKPLEQATTTALRGLLAAGVVKQLFTKYGLQDSVSPQINVNQIENSLPFPPGTTP
jgi:polar amino acid transport system substrate-binding protein